MPCSRPAGIRPSTGQTMSARAGWPRRVARVLARVTRSRTSEFEGSTATVAATSASAYGSAHTLRPCSCVTSSSPRRAMVAVAWDGGVPWVVGVGRGRSSERWESAGVVPARGCWGWRGYPRRCRSVSGWPRPERPRRRRGSRIRSEHGRVDGEVDARAAGAVEDAGHARVGPDGSLPGGLPGRVVAGEEADVRVERQGQHGGHLERDVLLATVPGDEGPRPAGGLGRALLDHLDRDRHGGEGVGGAQPPPRHRGRERSGLACRHGRNGRGGDGAARGRRAAGRPVVECRALVHRHVPAHHLQPGAGERAGQRCRDGAGDRDVLARAHHGGRQGVEDDDGDVLDRRHGGTVLERRADVPAYVVGTRPRDAALARAPPTERPSGGQRRRGGGQGCARGGSRDARSCPDAATLDGSRRPRQPVPRRLRDAAFVGEGESAVHLVERASRRRRSPRGRGRSRW